jgi:ABC-type amino acid transport substrate-binding protein
VTLTAAVVGGTRLLAGNLLASSDAKDDVLSRMEVQDRADTVTLSDQMLPGDAPLVGHRLAAIRARGELRIGYLDDALPFAYVNARRELVGLDAALMHALAKDFGVALRVAPAERSALQHEHAAAALLAQGSYDILVGGLAVTTARAAALQLSTPYLEETLGFVVPDGTRRRFESWDAIRAHPSLTIVAPDLPHYVNLLRQRLPRARIETVTSAHAIFETRSGAADAFALPAERGSAWTLRYPRYTVVVPSSDLIKVPLAFAMPRDEPELAAVVNTWVDLKRRDGTIDGLYRYWILGRDATDRRPRWSIVRDVLGWVD